MQSEHGFGRDVEGAAVLNQAEKAVGIGREGSQLYGGAPPSLGVEDTIPTFVGEIQSHLMAP